MPLEKLDFAKLQDIDEGRLREAFDACLARAELDCINRPGLKDKRVVELKLELVPIANDDGELDSIDVQFKFKDSAPSKVSKAYNMRSTGRGLYYNELSRDDVNQATMDFAPREEKKESS